MKRALFHKPGSLMVEYQEHREGPTPIYVAWKPNTAKSFTEIKPLLKFCAWPKSTPTGVELREWLEQFGVLPAGIYNRTKRQHQANHLMTISLPDFFRYYKNTAEQQEAVVLLEAAMPKSLLQDDSAWVVKYREKPAAPAWPVTKEQLGEIMLCNPGSLPDSLMDDLARCVENCAMDKLELVYFLGQVGHESAGLKYPMELHDGSNYEGRQTRNTHLRRRQYAGTGFIQVTGAYWHRV